MRQSGSPDSITYLSRGFRGPRAAANRLPTSRATPSENRYGDWMTRRAPPRPSSTDATTPRAATVGESSIFAEVRTMPQARSAFSMRALSLHDPRASLWPLDCPLAYGLIRHGRTVMKGLSGKVAVVTGAARGIGFAIANRMSSAPLVILPACRRIR
jgi:hypothetical protein